MNLNALTIDESLPTRLRYVEQVSTTNTSRFARLLARIELTKEAALFFTAVRYDEENKIEATWGRGEDPDARLPNRPEVKI